MVKSPRYKDEAQSLLRSPNSSSRTPTRPITTIPESTTFVQTDSSSFKQVVQMLTGFSKKPSYHNPTHQPDPRYSLPPIRPVPNMKQPSSSSSGFRIYERRNSKTHLEINPVRSGLPFNLSPSVRGFTSLLLSPDTPLLADPFYRPGCKIESPTDPGLEEREIREKGFYLHPSPSSTPTDPEPRLLPLFPLTSPQASESLPAST